MTQGAISVGRLRTQYVKTQLVLETLWPVMLNGHAGKMHRSQIL